MIALLASLAWVPIAAGFCAWAWHLGYEAGHKHGREFERVRIRVKQADAEGR